MICPFCGHSDTKVTDSRDTNDGKAIRRRRECEGCKARFSTYEEMEIMRLTVIKRDGTRQDYDREKMAVGIRKAFEKLNVSKDKIEKFIGDVEYEIHSKESNEIRSKDIGKIILRKLEEYDHVAYLRFASVYKSFKTVESFKKEVEKLSMA